jgi:poly-gamma-glutamate capsule biosynthesis protein CapA/YwtB (metallophosphatase superfamily)
VKERTIAWIGFSYLEDHNSLHNLTTAKTLVKIAQQKAAIVVISVHAGAEGTDAIRTQNVSESFFGEDRGNLVQFSHTLIDAGADLVLGHGPHVPRAIELYKGKLIAYSLGNFLGYRTLATEGALGTSLILQVHLDVQGNFISGKIIPVYLDAAGIPHVDQNFRSVRLIRELTQIDFPQTRLKIDRGGRILKLTNSGT